MRINGQGPTSYRTWQEWYFLEEPFFFKNCFDPTTVFLLLFFQLVKVSASTNLNLADRPTFVRPVDNRQWSNVQQELENAKKEGIRILFCVIPDSGPTYAKIKQLAETRIGVLTQCIKGSTVYKKRCDGSTISNILLKCNAKLNGTNHRLNDSPILKEKCMLIGADVTHPSPDQKNIPRYNFN